MKRLLLGAFLLPTFISAQISSFPYRERFDSTVAPLLPSGWSTSAAKNPSGDFTLTTSTVRSAPNAVSSTDATKEQYLISPVISFAGRLVDTLEFYERRTASHTSGLLVEAAAGDDTTFSIALTDTLHLQSSTAYVRRAVALPSLLNGKEKVRFRWRVTGTGTGTTGVIRFDDVSITVKKAVDLALTALTASSSPLKKGMNVALTAVIANRALAGTFSGTLTLFDSLQTVSVTPFTRTLAANDSTTVALSLPSIGAGRHPLRLVLQTAGDEDSTNDVRTLLLTAGYPARTLLINELMYTPPSGSPEWMELINVGPDTVPLAGWRVSDAGTTKALLLPSSLRLAPRSYLVVTTDTNAFRSAYEGDVPLAQASFSALNNSGDAAVLYDATLSVIDSLSFTSQWGGTAGRSLERIDTAALSALQSNWSGSLSAGGSTPGMSNSVSRKAFDAAAGQIFFTPAAPEAGKQVLMTISVRNAGLAALEPFPLRVYRDADGDSLAEKDEFLVERNVPSLPPGDSASFLFPLPPLPHGTHRFIAETRAVPDDDAGNDRRYVSLRSGLSPRRVLISEIHFAPENEEPEWFEVYNTTAGAVTLSGWRASDAGATRALVSGAAVVVPPYSYRVITPDTLSFAAFHPGIAALQASIGTLNNTTPDAVVLFDDLGRVMDSVWYRPSWGGTEGRSLQRYDLYTTAMDSADWRSAPPTPGAENAVGRKEHDVAVEAVTVTMLGSSATVTGTVRNNGRQNASPVQLRIAHDANRDSVMQQHEMLASLPIPPLAPGESADVPYVWSGVPSGRHVVLVRAEYAEDERSGDNTGTGEAVRSYAEGSVVINEVLYEPQSGGSEFVELFNRSGDTLDLSGWALLDQPSASGTRAHIPLSAAPRAFPPGGYLVVGTDSSLLLRFPELASARPVIDGALSLSNSGEDLVLTDLTGTRMDSVRYQSGWHLPSVITAGRSLERIMPNGPSTDGRNWSSSVSGAGATPGGRNSIRLDAAPSNASLTLTPNPFSPDADGFEDFLSISYTLPAASVTLRVRIYDAAGRLVRRLATGEPVPSSGTVVWDGRNDGGATVRMGMYIVLAEAFDNLGGTLRTMKEVAVVARKL